MMTALPTAPLAARDIEGRAAAPWITLHRSAPLNPVEILSKLTGLALSAAELPGAWRV